MFQSTSEIDKEGQNLDRLYIFVLARVDLCHFKQKSKHVKQKSKAWTFQRYFKDVFLEFLSCCALDDSPGAAFSLQKNRGAGPQGGHRSGLQKVSIWILCDFSFSSGFQYNVITIFDVMYSSLFS